MPLAVKPYLEAITPYIGGKTWAAGDRPVIKLSSNENPFGPSPQAITAFRQASDQLHRYPEDSATTLREALAAQHGIAAEQIIGGAGSDEVIGMIVHAYAGPGDEVIFTEHAFLMYRIYTQLFGATPVAVPETNLTADVDAILAAVTKRTRIVFLANPNNPTGSYLPADELARLRESLPPDVLLVIDGAYHEYVDAADYYDGRLFVEEGTATVLTRTFSKIYGLPALRLGWGYGPPGIINDLYKVREPFNITQPAIAAGIAALADSAHITECARINREQRGWLHEQVGALGLTASPSQGNFILMHCPDTAGLRPSELSAALLDAGVIVREVARYGLPHGLRVSVGTPAENQAFITALKECVGR